MSHMTPSSRGLASSALPSRLCLGSLLLMAAAACSGLPAGAKNSATSAQAGTPDPFTYFIQVGAFRTLEDAEAQRAKLSLSGIETKISEREQSGRTVYRVRMGPFDKREEADTAKARLDGAGIETALVRVQR